MTEPCRFHSELQKKIEDIGGTTKALEAYSKTHNTKLENLDQKLDIIQTAVDKNEVRAATRDESLSRIKVDVERVQRTIDNGLNARVSELSKAIEGLYACMNRRREEYLAKEKEQEEFSFWTKLLKGFARRLNDVWEKNGIIIVFFILWLLFGGKGNQSVLRDIARSLDLIP